jgi:hypothetical protein
LLGFPGSFPTRNFATLGPFLTYSRRYASAFAAGFSFSLYNSQCGEMTFLLKVKGQLSPMFPLVFCLLLVPPAAAAVDLTSNRICFEAAAVGVSNSRLTAAG